MGEPRNRVVQVRRYGGPDELEVVDTPLPTAGRGEVRVRVLASGLEYTDVVIRRHLYPQTAARRPPFVLGYDVVGEIDQLGDGVSGFQLGDRVADMTVLGSNAASRTLRASDLTRVPAGVDAAEAAALILSWTTAYQLLHRAAGCSEDSACSCMEPPAPSARRCSYSARWPGLGCAPRAASTRR
jgi:NADPH:quinone reductase